jgi:hypothetical protein
MRKSTSSHGKEDHFRCRRSSRSGESDRRASILYLIICRVLLGDTAPKRRSLERLSRSVVTPTLEGISSMIGRLVATVEQSASRIRRF